jgi:hypothetical protein
MFARGLEAREQEFLESLHVMEVGMRHFFAKAMHAKTNKGKPETIDANMLQAVSIAEKIAPYKHARLSAVKLAGDPNNPARFKDDATADELRAELMKRLQILTSAGLIDLQALPAPDGGNSESADARRRSIGDERGVTRTRSFQRTVSISATQRNLLFRMKPPRSAERASEYFDRAAAIEAAKPPVTDGLVP